MHQSHGGSITAYNAGVDKDFIFFGPNETIDGFHGYLKVQNQDEQAD
ncbi:MAG: hypothetical protein AAF490_26635 [Chloroflexota bacterium]